LFLSSPTTCGWLIESAVGSQSGQPLAVVVVGRAAKLVRHRCDLAQLARILEIGESLSRESCGAQSERQITAACSRIIAICAFHSLHFYWCITAGRAKPGVPRQFRRRDPAQMAA
jgi:hypothetical protein